LQNARAAREEVFAELANIVFFANSFFDKMIERESGHDVEVVIKEGNDVTRMLKQVILAEIMLKNKANGKLMTKKEKVDFVLEWKKQSKKMLEDGGMVPRKEMNVFPSSTLVMHFRIAMVGHATSSNAMSIAPMHSRGHRNGRQMSAWFPIVDFVIDHNRN
jgi:hypothetical protein